MHRHYALIALFLVLVYSCKSVSQRDYRKGQRQVDNLNYFLGIDYFLKSWDRSPQPESARALAQAYFHLRDFQQAEEWYSKLNRDGSLLEEDLLPFAEVLIANSKYSEAARILSLAQDKQEPRWVRLSSTAAQAAEQLNQASGFSVSALSEVNTAYDEFGPSLTEDSLLLFVSDRLEGKVRHIDANNALKSDLYGWTGNGFLKVYEARWKEDPTNLEGAVAGSADFQSKLHIGPVAKADEMDFATITQQQKFVKTDKKCSARNYTLFPELFFRDNQARDAGFVSFSFNSPFKYSVSDPFYHAQSRRLYFSSDMQGGFGEADLYYVDYLGDGRWGQPVNLGEAVNTTGRERSPFLAESGSLYFSSEGHPGLGGLDVFVAEYVDDSYQAPQNLGSPINSNRDDFGFFKAEKAKGLAFFASDRGGGRGLDDIYFAREKAVKFTLQGKVYDLTSNELLAEAVVTLADRDGQQLGVYVSQADGSFRFQVEPGGELRLSGRKTGYLNSELLSLSIPLSSDPADSVLVRDIFLDKIEVGKVYSLENIYYDFDKWEIREDAKPELEKLLRIMNENPTLKIELHSHTDSRGPAEYNLTLSDKRAHSVVAYLESRGIRAGRMVAVGFGEEKLLNACGDSAVCTEVQHQQNRRTEFKITEY
ncbi:OmpA family protein [Algoriphagus sp. H41]|uniref:OmpA family protein n=1 Tax=Algoriphagus oliviformis TaxID=2811231 RepID=A0ABS3C7G3_9BACT|nr:OmpA family protein [Algoriphagus oliviformis]MBN7813053.1 OmpA family protein [Algoriphagus oliviformis]